MLTKKLIFFGLRMFIHFMLLSVETFMKKDVILRTLSSMFFSVLLVFFHAFVVAVFALDFQVLLIDIWNIWSFLERNYELT